MNTSAGQAQNRSSGYSDVLENTNILLTENNFDTPESETNLLSTQTCNMKDESEKDEENDKPDTDSSCKQDCAIAYELHQSHKLHNSETKSDDSSSQESRENSSPQKVGSFARINQFLRSPPSRKEIEQLWEVDLRKYKPTKQNCVAVHSIERKNRVQRSMSRPLAPSDGSKLVNWDAQFTKNQRIYASAEYDSNRSFLRFVWIDLLNKEIQRKQRKIYIRRGKYQSYT